MDSREATELLRKAIPDRGGMWADLGAGEGTFTRALVNLAGPRRVYAVDRDARAIAELMSWGKSESAEVIPVIADFSSLSELPGLDGGKLDGILLANSLHYVSDPEPVLTRLVGWLRPGGRVVLIEYDRREANRWVPFPIPIAKWTELAAAAGLSAPVITGTRPSEYGGNLYVAVSDLPAAPLGHNVMKGEIR